jgi:hypothetical protein
MRVTGQFGSDTGMALGDVYLETEAECALDRAGLFAALSAVLAEQGLSLDHFVDLELFKKTPDGNWKSVGLLW